MSGPPTRAASTMELVLAPQVRTFGRRRWMLALLAAPMLAVAAYVAVVRLAGLEQMLVAGTQHVSRAVLCEVPRGGSLVAPIEPGTQILRLAMHAYRRSGELPLGKRKVHLRVVGHGTRAERVEDVDVGVPGERTRVSSDEPGLAVGDPVSIDFDVHDLGVGELTVSVGEVDQADGVMVRMYRREEVSPEKAYARDDLFDRARKNHFARWAWELAWDDVSSFEQEEILSDRWRRVGALRGAGHDLRSIAVALVPAPPEVERSRTDDSMGGTALRGDERLSFLIHGHGAVRIVSDASATLKALVRDARGGARPVEAHGELQLESPADETAAVEVTADRDVVVDVRTQERKAVEWYGHARAWRPTESLPVVVESPEAARLLRVTLRRPMPRGAAGEVPVGAAVEVAGPNLRVPVRRIEEASRARSRFDRYGAFDPVDTPSERFFFYVAVPRGGRATISPVGHDPLDVSLSELRESAAPEPLEARSVDDARPPMQSEGTVSWDGFVARCPSNDQAFDDRHRALVRVAKHLVAVTAPASSPSLVRFEPPHPAGKPTDARAFVPALGGWKGVVPTHPAIIPLRLSGEAGAAIDVRVVAGGRAQAELAGVFERVTLPRRVTVGAGVTRATLPVGEDIPAGPVTVELSLAHDDRDAAPSAPHGVPLVHLPWETLRTASAPRWIAGDFEE